MRRNWLFVLAIAALASPVLAQSEPVREVPKPLPQQPPAKPPLATNNKKFFIPVTVDRTGKDHLPVEVQLLVSTDQGKTWSTFARQSAESKGFQFQAKGEGRYWFASRTLDAQGKSKPAEIEPELEIVIDSTLPKIEFDAAAAGTGEIKAAWRITEPNVAADSVRLEYQSGDATKPAWQQVPLEGLQNPTGEMLIGAATWSPTGNNRAIDLRLVVVDKAGNEAVGTQRVYLPKLSKAEPKVPEWPPRPVAKSQDKTPATDPFASRQFGEGKSLDPSTADIKAKPASSSPEPEISRPGSIPWPADNKVSAPPVEPSPRDKVATLPTTPLPKQSSEVAPPVTDRVVAKPSSTGGTSPYIWPNDSKAEPDAATPGALTSIPQENSSPEYQPPTTREPADEVDAPSGEKPQITASKSFSLEYDLDSVGPAGVRAVELWVTIDGGRTWEKWGEDEDRRSPFEIQVQSERTFGFRMVIVANNGLAGRSPEPGDAADIWVTVDSTKPRARLLQAAYGQGENAGKLDIRWEADDPHLTARPITLSFAESSDGPYTTLAAGLPNNGQYFWTIDPHTPRKLYLRLEAKDEAGNASVDQTLEPVSLEGLSPKGRIKAVMPGPNTSPSPIKGAFHSPLFK